MSASGRYMPRGTYGDSSRGSYLSPVAMSPRRGNASPRRTPLSPRDAFPCTRIGTFVGGETDMDAESVLTESTMGSCMDGPENYEVVKTSQYQRKNPLMNPLYGNRESSILEEDEEYSRSRMGGDASYRPERDDQSSDHRRNEDTRNVSEAARKAREGLEMFFPAERTSVSSASRSRYTSREPEESESGYNRVGGVGAGREHREGEESITSYSRRIGAGAGREDNASAGRVYGGRENSNDDRVGKSYGRGNVSEDRNRYARTDQDVRSLSKTRDENKMATANMGEEPTEPSPYSYRKYGNTKERDTESFSRERSLPGSMRGDQSYQSELSREKYRGSHRSYQQDRDIDNATNDLNDLKVDNISHKDERGDQKSVKDESVSRERSLHGSMRGDQSYQSEVSKYRTPNRYQHERNLDSNVNNTSVKDEIVDLKKKLDEYEAKMSHTETKLHESEASAARLADENALLEEKIQTVNEDFTKDNNELSKVKMDLENEINVLCEENKSLMEKVEMKDQENRAALAGKDKAMNSLRSTIADLEASIKNNYMVERESKESFKSLALELSKVKNEKSELERKVEDNNREMGIITKLEENLRSSQDTVNALEQALSIKDKTLSSLRVEVIEAKKGSSMEKNQVAENDALRNKLSDQTREMSALQKDMETEIEALNAEKKSMAHDFEITMEKLYGKNDYLENALFTQEKTINTLQSDLRAEMSNKRDYGTRDRFRS